MKDECTPEQGLVAASAVVTGGLAAATMLAGDKFDKHVMDQVPGAIAGSAGEAHRRWAGVMSAGLAVVSGTIASEKPSQKMMTALGAVHMGLGARGAADAFGDNACTSKKKAVPAALVQAALGGALLYKGLNKGGSSGTTTGL